MKKLLSSTLALLLLWNVGGTGPAQEYRPGGTGRAKPRAGNVKPAQGAATTKPFITVSFAGYNALRGQIDAVGKLAGNPGLARGLEAAVTLVTQGKGLAGLDKTRPWGAVVPVSSQDRTFDLLAASYYVFVPVTDLKQLAALLPDPTNGKPLAPGADGVYEIKFGPGDHVYIMQKGSWAFLAGNREVFKDVPADPAALLGDLPGRYALACRVSMRALPPQLRMWMTGQVQMFARMLQQGGFNGNIEDEEGEVIGGAVLQQFFQNAPALINELDEVVCGLAIAADGKSAHLDCRLTVAAGSATARKFARLKGTTTLLAGFGLPEAAVTAHWVAAMDDFDLAQATNSLAGFQAQAARRLDDSEDLTKDQSRVAKQLLSDAVAVVQKTLQGKKIDCGLALSLRPRASTLLCGGVIAGGEDLDKVVKQLIAQIRADDPDSTKSLKLDAEVHEGVHFHVASTAVTSEDLVALLGERIEVVLGIGADRLYLGVGGHALAALKEAITKSKAAAGEEVPPLRISAAGTPVAAYAAATLEGPDKLKALKIADLLKKSPAQDHATLTFTPVPQGAIARLEIEEGLLKALGRVVPALLLPDPAATLRGSIPLHGRNGEKAEPDPFDNN